MGIINFDKVRLKDGFWKYRYDLNINVTIRNIIKRFEDTRFSAIRFTYKEKNNNQHRAFDSDVAKLIEAIAYVLTINPNKYKEFEELADDLIENIKKHQRKDGYFNSYFQAIREDEVFTHRTEHELYNLGHLIEAAIAYHYATKKDTLLKCCYKYIDYVYDRFMVKKDVNFVTPGHEEIELALLRLYEYTKNRKYYRLASFFLEKRGNNSLDTYEEFGNSRYAQDNEKIRELSDVEGHAVRAMYLYDGMAKYAKLSKDKEIVNALYKLYDSMMSKQYITGSIGSCRMGEIFTIPYDLPPLTAYSESCASIAEMMFLLDLYNIKQDKKYHDDIERILYNGFLSSTSLDGKAFFYENPLEIRHKEINKETSIANSLRQILPITKRVELFDCSCCPPNIARFVASISKYIYYEKGNKLYINQFISSDIDLDNVYVNMESFYPKDFRLNLNINVKNDKEYIYLRVPSYCDYAVVNGETYKKHNGYLVFELSKGTHSINVFFNTKVRFIESNPNNPYIQNKVAIMFGPIVYALESIDNNIDELNAIYLKKNKNISIEYSDVYKMMTLKKNGYIKEDSHKPYSLSYTYSETLLTFIPYYCFANREESDMIVWINKKY